MRTPKISCRHPIGVIDISERRKGVCQICGKIARCSPTDFRILLKPTIGFFENYIIGDDLHIGICDFTKNSVFSYTDQGVVEESYGDWANALSICELEQISSDTFDAFLEESNDFNSLGYSEATWNCFDFVLAFLRFSCAEDNDAGLRQISRQHLAKSIVSKMIRANVL